MEARELPEVTTRLSRIIANQPTFGQQVREAVTAAGAGERYNDRKVYLAAVAARMNLTVAEATDRLLEANRAGEISLARIDLPHLGEWDLIEASHIHHMGRDFHVVIDWTKP